MTKGVPQISALPLARRACILCSGDFDFHTLLGHYPLFQVLDFCGVVGKTAWVGICGACGRLGAAHVGWESADLAASDMGERRECEVLIAGGRKMAVGVGPVMDSAAVLLAEAPPKIPVAGPEVSVGAGEGNAFATYGSLNATEGFPDDTDASPAGADGFPAGAERSWAGADGLPAGAEGSRIATDGSLVDACACLPRVSGRPMDTQSMLSFTQVSQRGT